MEDAELTRIAVQEIIRELGERKQPPRQQECKINPLGKTNKRFLGRTINSMISHNKREDERKHRNCQRKLRDLQHRHRKKKQTHYTDGREKPLANERQRAESESSHEVFSSSSSDSTASQEKARKKLKAKKKKKKKKKSKKRKHKHSDSCTSDDSTASEKCAEDYCADYEGENGLYSELHDGSTDFYVDHNAAHNMALAAATYSHVNQYLHYQALLVSKAQTTAEEPIDEDDDDLADFKETELKDLVSLPATAIVKPEEISLLETSSSSSDSESGNLSGEKGILTIDLSSDEENDERRQKQNDKTVFPLDSKVQICDHNKAADDDDDKRSNASSCISLNSSTNAEDNDDAVEVEILSSSSSEAEMDTTEIPKTEELPPVPNTTYTNSNVIVNTDAVDLTLD